MVVKVCNYFIPQVNVSIDIAMEEFVESDLLVFTHHNLKKYTDDFSEENFIGETHFGKLYRGTIPHGLDSDRGAAHHVTVKIWENLSDNESRLNDEELLLTDPSVITHPNLVKLIGICRIGSLGAVYDLNPWNTLHNLIVSDIFSWPQRIKVALGFARLLEFLHCQDGPYMVRNISADHILIDKECNPLLCDFSMLSGGVLGNMPRSDRGLWGCFGYIDVHLASSGGGWSIECDVYSYGCVLLSLIAKRVVDKNHTTGTHVDEWAKKEYKPPRKELLVKQLVERKVAPKRSLVHKSLEGDPNFDALDGPMITDLAMSCVEFEPSSRPTMMKVVRKLQGLYLVKSRGEAYLASNQS